MVFVIVSALLVRAVFLNEAAIVFTLAGYFTVAVLIPWPATSRRAQTWLNFTN